MRISKKILAEKIRHGNRLATDMIPFCQKHDREKLDETKNEVSIRNRVWKWINDGADPGDFSTEEFAWWKYMYDDAILTIRYDAKEFCEHCFQYHAQKLRQRRDDELNG